MITEKEVVEVANVYLEGHEFVVARSNGGWPTPCGWQISIVDEIVGSLHTLFVHESNDKRSLRSKMINFADYAFNPAE